MAATVVTAVLAGGATGLGLHAWRPDPLTTVLGAGRQSSPPNDPGDGTPTPTAGPRPSRSSSTSPSASPTSSPSASRSSSAESSPPSTSPAFTKLALFRTTDFTTHGWAVSRVTNSYSQLPDPPITPCVTISAGDTGVRAGYAGSWSSDRTQAIELVARYTGDTAARKAFRQIENMIENCDSTAYDQKVMITSAARSVEADGVDEIRWFNTRGGDSDDTRGVLGVVRSADRIALVEISSSEVDPDDTHDGGSTDVAALLGIAGRRLV